MAERMIVIERKGFVKWESPLGFFYDADPVDEVIGVVPAEIGTHIIGDGKKVEVNRVDLDGKEPFIVVKAEFLNGASKKDKEPEEKTVKISKKKKTGVHHIVGGKFIFTVIETAEV